MKNNSGAKKSKFIIICLSFLVSMICSTHLLAQTNIIGIRHQLKDSLIARFNRDDFKSIHGLIDTSWKISEQDFCKNLKNNKNNYGRMLKATFLVDSACNRCTIKRANYYALEFQLKTLLLLLTATPEGKISDLGLLNYTFPENEKMVVKTNNPLRNSFDLSVDSAAKTYFRNPHATALSIGIIKNGRRFTYHYGEISKGFNQLPTDETIYELGSVTKTFTSTILANAVLENRVRLTDDIRNYLSEPYPNLEYNGQPITLQHLSNHTSRIPAIPDDFYTYAGFDPLKPWNEYTKPMFWKSLHRVVIDTVPGYKFQYSNVAVSLLGHILENVYKVSFDELIKKYVTGPMNMKNTRINTSRKKQKHLASKYSSNGNLVPYWIQPAFSPSGVGMLTDLEDMLHFLDQQLMEKDNAIQLTHKPTANNLGLGWGVGNMDTKYRKIEHSGGTSGFSTNIKGFPEIKTGLVILANNDLDLTRLIRQLSSLIVK